MSDADPPYLRIAGELRERIATGRLRPGDRVPSTRAIMRDWGVALATATKALAVLGNEGLVDAVPRVGTVVAARRLHQQTPQRAARRPARPGARPGGALTVDRIVRCAVETADRDGIAALSMRGIAGRLEVPTMSLYRHVRSKDELVLLMIDATFGEEPYPAVAPTGWRETLAASARLQWASYRRHPWLAQVISLTRPQPLVNLFRIAEWNLTGLVPLGLGQQDLLDIHMTVCIFVRGVAIGLAPELEATEDTGLTGDEWADVDQPLIELLTNGPFPTFREVSGMGNYDLDLDRLFEFGLQRVLDGMEEMVSNR
ncbi:TetR/AcrR family transcriptional regulator [Pseudonocardia sp. TRM90224]|uniref:TetR/AcrR family transcriptional regulator n=1 Tax=Pseudonocardia sp. TRM90224 TaxID=2812678 RepID=UPI001E507088|nr:TetR/AcrR family transcriptional regulator C-terminal domain-containing protein [Pseudonocardia sp. TRM90224]